MFVPWGVQSVKGYNFKMLIDTVIAPSGCARSKLSLQGEQESSMWQFQQNKKMSRDSHVSPMDFLRMTILKIERSLDVFWRKRGMTVKKYLCNRRVTLLTVILGLVPSIHEPLVQARE